MNKLLTISLIISILGIFLLLLISNFQEPKLTKIKDINDNILNKDIQIQGKIVKIRTYENFQAITLNDSTAIIQATIDNPINLSLNQTLIIMGKITEYQNQLQIKAERIII